MQMDCVQEFKNECRAYRGLKRQLKKLSEDLYVVNHKMTTCGGPKYDGMPHNEYNPFAPNPLTDLSIRKTELEQEIRIIWYRIRKVDDALAKMNHQDASDIRSIYIFGDTIQSCAAKRGITERMEKYYIDQAIASVIVENC